MRLKFGAFLLLLLAVPDAASAQQAQPRTLSVPANASWQHAETGMILPSRSAGLAREDIRDTTDAELDVIASYQNRDEGITATVYLYRTMTPDAALWFDRALTAIALRPEYRLEGAPRVPAGFTRPGGSTASGLRAALSSGAPDLSGTAVAIAPLGGWLVKIRLSAARLDRAAIDDLLTRFIQGLRWPAETRAERVAVPIAPCPTPLRLRQARVVRDDGAQVLLNLLAGAVVARNDHGPPPVYCREPGATLEYGVYRANVSTEAYLIAVSDAGIALSVGQALRIDGLSGGGGGRYSMMLEGRGTTSALPSFNRLPPPRQAMAVAFGNHGPTISVSTGDARRR